jgi:ribosomal protein S18 acetylase RimI-like enzyme
MKNIQIRLALEADVADLFALIQAKAEFDGCLDSLRADEQTLRTAFFSDKPKANALVAVSDGKVVGMATYYDIYSSFIAKPGIWLDDLYVYEDYRQYGVGKALMTKLCELAHQKCCARIDWIVAGDNENGLAFYDKLGATIFENVRHARLDEAAIARVVKGNT